MTLWLWLLAHPDLVVGMMFGLHALAVAIVNLTPTPADDLWVGKAYKFIEALAGIFSTTAKALPPKRGDPR